MGGYGICVIVLFMVATQTAVGENVQPDEPTFCTGCSITDQTCECTLTIEHRLTMLHTANGESRLVKPLNGKLAFANNIRLNDEQARNVISADGFNSRLVITINGQFPGPRIMAYENQEIRITVVNKMHTDSTTIHVHGLHQRDTPWMDGVAFVTQCPILPGQTFVYKFKASPSGTMMYHAHIGDQRSMGLYGPLIIRKKDPPYEVDEFVLTLQDWNHDDDAETSYARMVTANFNFNTLQEIKTTYSFDRGNFSRFVFHSGLVNGKGRYYGNSFTVHNAAPLERFKIKAATAYRFRVIGATTLYPLRIFIEGHPLKLLASDGFDIEPKTVRSIVIQPGERFDFEWTSPSPSQLKRKEILFTAVSLETDESLTSAGLGYHGAEAVLEVEGTQFPVNSNPTNLKTEDCTFARKCLVFNCPFSYYPPSTYRECLTFADIKNNYPAKDTEAIMGTPSDTLFFNFAFPPDPDNLDITDGSVNGKTFVSPSVSMLTQTGGRTSCESSNCASGVCPCTHTVNILKDRLIQMVFLNLGSGRGWSHPVHLHGHSFFVMKMGYAVYNKNTGAFIAQNSDIVCDKVGDREMCINASWSNSSWRSGNIPDMNDDPPQKDTIIVPTGGYVVIRFVSDNPGMWFLHCHIDLHNTNGMGMVINEAGDQHLAPPVGFPTCGNFMFDGISLVNVRDDLISGSGTLALTGIGRLLLVGKVAHAIFGIM